MWFSMLLNRHRRPRRETTSATNNSSSSTIDFPTLTMRSLRQRPPSSSNFNNNDDLRPANTVDTPSMPLLYGLARSWAWEAVCFRCQTHPHEASAAITDHRGDNVLHWTVFGHPPEHVVSALLTACPTLAAHANRQGLYPLHVACSYRASAAVIQLLLDAASEAAGPTGAANNASALHLLCDYGTTPAAIAAVLRTPSGVATVSQEDSIYRRRPLHILNGRKNMRACQVARDGMRDVRRRLRAVESSNRCHESDDDVAKEIGKLKAQLDDYAESDVWRKVALLLVAEADAAVLSPEGPAPARIVQAAVEITDCPPSFQEYAILLYAEHLTTRNAEGQLPLHLAAARPHGTALLLDLLEACPAAALERNAQGELPLQTLLLNSHRSDRLLTWVDGVGALVEANPAALAELGLPDALYPTIWSRLSSPEALFLAIRAFPGNFGRPSSTATAKEV